MSVLLVSNYSFLSLAVTRCLGGAGLSVHVMGPDAWPTVRFSRHCARYTQVPLTWFRPPYEEAFERIQAYCREHGIEAVVPADLDAHLLIASVKERLDFVKVFPVPSPERLQQMHDKWEFACFCVEHGIPHPPTTRIDRLEQLEGLEWSKPLMIKPILGANSEGVVKLASREALDAELAKGRQPPFLIQEFSPGIDIDMSVLGNQGQLVAWTIQVGDGDPQAREFLRNDAVYAVGQALVEKSKYTGVAHFDLRLSPTGEARVLECNPRFWLSCPFSMWAGVNFADLGLKLAEGENPARLMSQMIEGTCRRPTLGLRSLASGVLQRGDMTVSSRRAFWQMYADPAPQIMAKVFSAAKRVGLSSLERY